MTCNIKREAYIAKQNIYDILCDPALMYLWRYIPVACATLTEKAVQSCFITSCFSSSTIV